LNLAALHSLASGFAVSLSLILAIGAQNAFVLRQGLRGRHVLAVVAICAISDAILIAAGVAGFGAAAQALPWLAPAMRWAGAGFLLVYGFQRFRAALKGGEHLDPAAQAADDFWPVATTCLALTWLNPHVYLDTLMLIGSLAAGHPGHETAFGIGAASASAVFFTTLGFGAALLRPIFARPQAWQALETIVGLTMWTIAASLILG
jgi:L-lysine exporter family protein LysE/ArgO